ncbi:DUF2059 domain-containing protein [Marinobacter sp.]|uniref:DUF2059 domain-containing protein n=1 Tax=Marinobacter sp. TaxID=50741 RepID=UPI00198DDCED|nr:DUF2059 domain-containing protein [Marinobacter sp.]MBC7191416.1 DUF2059 domain-containing protein [Marinobacter sp.]
MPDHRSRITVWKATVFTVLFASAVTTHAAPTAQQVVDASPIDDIIDQYPAMLNEGIRRGLSQGTQLQPFLVNSIGAVVSSAFSGADIERQVVEDLQSSLGESQLAAVADWYQTPLAKRISKAEIEASSPSAWKAVQAKGPALVKEYQGTELASLFDRYDQAARATQSAVDTAIAMQFSMAAAMNALKGSGAMPVGELRQQVESRRTMLRGQVGQQVYTAYLYTYNAFTPEELREYLAFLESDAGSAFTRISTQSIQKALMEPVDMISRKLSQLLGNGAP